MGLDCYMFATAAKLPSDTDFVHRDYAFFDPENPFENGPDAEPGVIGKEFYHMRSHYLLHSWAEVLYFQKGGKGHGGRCSIVVALNAMDVEVLRQTVRDKSFELLPRFENRRALNLRGTEHDPIVHAADTLMVEWCRRKLSHGLNIYYNGEW